MAGKELNEIIIDNMLISDLQEVVAIEKASFTKPWSETLFYKEIHNHRSVAKVARIDKKVAGYVCANLIIDEGHILDLAVHPEFRRLGIASRLVAHAIDFLKSGGCRIIFLEVRSSNGIARRMYEKFGFKVIGIRKNYYVLPVEDAIIMSLEFEK
ncbi:MAG: ribosomal protein S18-alanine N-acetyltransferase [Nitrospirota bacterium]